MTTTIRHPLPLAAVAVLLLLVAPPAGAEDDAWEDPRADRLEEAVRALEREARTGRTPGEPGVALRHGHVRMVADLARVDVVLEVENPGEQVIQWQRSFEIDPRAELIGASLERGSGDTIEARTLTLDSARRIYDEIARPPTRTVPTPWGGRDPLRIERPGGHRLDLAVWPIAAGETVKVHLDFVTPLVGHGDRRTYRDVIAADLGGSNAPPRRGAVTTPPAEQPRTAVEISLDTDWLVHPGGLLLDAAPTGMLHTETVGERMHFVAAKDVGDRVPTLPLRTPGAPEDRVLAVPGGGLMSRIAVWRFDPHAFARAHRLRIPTGATLHLVGRRGSTYRIAPWTFTLGDDPRPVTARLSPRSPTLRYAVEIRDEEGRRLETVEIERDVDRTKLDDDRAGAITGWHRAMLARRVLAWGRAGDASDREAALAYAVDLGVLVEGTAALAVPRAELETLSRRSRREYRRDGVPLGAQEGEADFRQPPRGSVPR